MAGYNWYAASRTSSASVSVSEWKHFEPTYWRTLVSVHVYGNSVLVLELCGYDGLQYHGMSVQAWRLSKQWHTLSNGEGVEKQLIIVKYTCKEIVRVCTYWLTVSVRTRFFGLEEDTANQVTFCIFCRRLSFSARLIGPFIRILLHVWTIAILAVIKMKFFLAQLLDQIKRS